MFRVRDDGNWYWWNLGGWKNTKHAIEKSVGGAKSIGGNEVPARIETGRWYDIRIELEGPRIRCYLDGKLVHDVQDRGLPALAAVASRTDRDGGIILKVVNVSDAAQDARIELEGVRKLRPTAQAWTLSGRPEDENTLEQPARVAPRQTKVRGLSKEFAYRFPAHSLTVLRLKPRRPGARAAR